MTWLLAFPIVLQGILILIDEFGYHLKRPLTRWERLGHPLDTLSLLACVLWVLLLPLSARNALVYFALAALSTVLITKDEWLHAKHCSAGELWIHSLLFILHPLVLVAAALSWPWLSPASQQGLAFRFEPDAGFLKTLFKLQLLFGGAFLLYQVSYWNFVFPRREEPRTVNNDLYHSLHEGWYSDREHPIALLRLESRLRNPWILSRIRAHFDARPCRILDIGCGAGFLSNAMAEAGHAVVGIDLSQESLQVARRHDPTGRVQYLHADALAAPFRDSSFDVVCAMDFLEHVEDPKRIVDTAARFLKPGGLLFFHTFDRNPLSWLVAIKGMEWFIRKTPKNLHIYRLFIRPRELKGMCQESGLQVLELAGMRPRLSGAFWKMLLTGKVPENFRFTFTRSLLIGYTGMAEKK